MNCFVERVVVMYFMQPACCGEQQEELGKNNSLSGLVSHQALLEIIWPSNILKGKIHD
jgi:hypothetical protein